MIVARQKFRALEMSSSQQSPEPADADIRPLGGDAQDFALLVGLRWKLLLAASGAASAVKLVSRSVVNLSAVDVPIRYIMLCYENYFNI
jgi:hypothetical protein